MSAARSGMTFVELMMVIVIIGLLSTLVIPKLRGGQERAFVSSMKSDLRNFAVAEESYYYDFATYAGASGVLESRGFQTSTGVTITITEATAVGWSAAVAHAGTLVGCYLFVGDAAPVGAASEEGRVSCG